MKACSVKLLVSAALSFLLSGCLFSNAPLITAANSDRPLPAYFLIAPEDKPGDSAEVDLADDSGYILHYPATGAGQSAAFPDEKLYFKKITDNIYAISRPIIEDNALRGYIYGYLRIIADKAQLRIEYHPASDGEDSKTPDDFVTVDLATQKIVHFQAP